MRTAEPETERESDRGGVRENRTSGNCVAFDVVLPIITTSIRRPLLLVVLIGGRLRKEKVRVILGNSFMTTSTGSTEYFN